MSELGEHGVPEQPPEDLPDDSVWMPGLDETLRDIAYHQSGMRERTELILKLREALAWALRHGIQAQDYTGSITFVDRGCGCCSGSETPPAHLELLLVEIGRQAVKP